MMHLTLYTARMKQAPADNGIRVPGGIVRRGRFSTDADVSGFLPAKEHRVQAASFYVRAKNASVSLD